ncbi:hypothetical protein ACWEKT_06605 [Nocardia takedensis]
MGLGFLFLISLPALFCILIGLGTYRRRGKIGDVGIMLTPERISIDYSEGPTVLEWANLSAVEGRCVWEESKVGSKTNVIRLVSGELGSHRITDIRHKDLESDPTRLFHLLAFYLRNPDLRAELASERGLQRFREAAYLPEHSATSHI